MEMSVNKSWNFNENNNFYFYIFLIKKLINGYIFKIKQRKKNIYILLTILVPIVIEMTQTEARNL